ncbi:MULTISPECIES: vWA domain-containing protein [Fischerella]|nr:MULTISPECIES: VWA domain-containing protein [Fischerella]
MSISQLSTAFAQTTPKGGIDWILVVDTSASMRGVGGTKNIFDQVKNSITEFVNTARLGDTITIYTFDRDVTLHANDITITSNPDRGKLKQIISAFRADGVRTHTGKAMQQALQHSARLNQRADAVGRSRDREKLSLALATEFSFQEIYEELKEDIEVLEHDLIYQSLQQFAISAKDLAHKERKLLDNLLSEYNPLN